MQRSKDPREALCPGLRNLHARNKGGRRTWPPGLGFLPGRDPDLGGQPSKTPRATATLSWRPGLLPAGCCAPPARSQLCPTPPSRRKRDEGGRTPSYSQAPTDSCAAVTTDENPGPLGELLPLLIPTSPSMNTQQPLRSLLLLRRETEPRTTSEAESRNRWSSGLPAPPSVPALSQSAVDPPARPASAFRIQSVPKASVGPRLPQGLGAGDLGEPGERTA